MIATWHHQPELKIYESKLDLFFVSEDWNVHLVTDDAAHYTLHVPEGFITDGPSIPWLAQIFTPVNGFNRLAGLPHDALYCIQGGALITRAQTDRLFYNMVGRGLRSWLMHRSLCIAGGAAWGDTSAVDKLNIGQGTLPTLKIV